MIEFRIAAIDERGQHVWFSLFAGAPGKTGACIGRLCMAVDEFEIFKRLLEYQHEAQIYHDIADEMREILKAERQDGENEYHRSH